MKNLGKGLAALSLAWFISAEIVGISNVLSTTHERYRMIMEYQPPTLVQSKIAIIEKVLPNWPIPSVPNDQKARTILAKKLWLAANSESDDIRNYYCDKELPKVLTALGLKSDGNWSDAAQILRNIAIEKRIVDLFKSSNS